MFWKKKNQADVPAAVKVVKKHNNLMIKMKDGQIFYWHVRNWDGVSKTKPWRRFYTWFFGRTGDIFVMRSKQGETVFKRKDIMRFTVEATTDE